MTLNQKRERGYWTGFFQNFLQHLSQIIFFLIERLASYVQYNAIFLQKSIYRVRKLYVILCDSTNNWKWSTNFTASSTSVYHVTMKFIQRFTRTLIHIKTWLGNAILLGSPQGYEHAYFDLNKITRKLYLQYIRVIKSRETTSVSMFNNVRTNIKCILKELCVFHIRTLKNIYRV